MKLKKTQASTSLHFRNEENAPTQEEAGEMLNHQSPGTLIDPEDDTGGNTHTPIEASKKLVAKKKVKAGTPVKAEFPPGAANKFKKNAEDVSDDGKLNDSEDEEDEDTEVDADITGKDDNCKQDVGHIPNDIDPAAGYLTNASGEDDDDEWDGEDPDAVEADFDGAPASLKHGSNPQSVLEAGDEEWDDGEGGEGDDAGGMGGEGGGDEFGEDDAMFNNTTGDDITDTEDQEEIDEPAVAGADEMALCDVDGMDDDGDNVAFAAYGTRLLALKGTRAIAHLSKKLAVKAGYDDVYLSDNFQDAVGVEMSKAGLRKGLVSMGFILATVNVAKSDVLNKRVEAKVKTVTAAVRRSSHASTAKMEQCMAIAAVGINRKYFKDTENQLRAGFEAELTAAGMRGASKMVQRVFAEHGIAYAKSMVTLANKLSEMTQAGRDAIAEALDMTDEADFEDNDELFGDSTSQDFQAEQAGNDEDFVDDFDDELETPQTIQAALLRPARNIQRAAVTANTRNGSANRSGAKHQLSASAMAILNGDTPLRLL